MTIENNWGPIADNFKALQNYLGEMKVLIDQRDEGTIKKAEFTRKFYEANENLQAFCSEHLKILGAKQRLLLEKTPDLTDLKSLGDLKFFFLKLIEKIERLLKQTQPERLIEEVKELYKEVTSLIESRQVSEQKAEEDGKKLIAKQKELAKVEEQVLEAPSEVNINEAPISEEEVKSKDQLESEQASKEGEEEIETGANDLRPGGLTSSSVEEVMPALAQKGH